MRNMLPTRNIISDRGPEPVGPYPHAKQVGEFIFVSGIGPRQRGQRDIPGTTRDASGAVVGHDIAVQARSCFENIRMILEDAGVPWSNVVDVTAFLTHLKPDFAEYNRVFAEFFAQPGGPNPTRTTVEVTALPTEIAIELKVIAIAPSGQGE